MELANILIHIFVLAQDREFWSQEKIGIWRENQMLWKNLKSRIFTLHIYCLFVNNTYKYNMNEKVLRKSHILRGKLYHILIIFSICFDL